MVIYDTMQYVSCDVGTICLGMAASMGLCLLCAGTPRKRYDLPHSRVLMHQASARIEGPAGGYRSTSCSTANSPERRV